MPKDLSAVTAIAFGGSGALAPCFLPALETIRSTRRRVFGSPEPENTTRFEGIRTLAGASGGCFPAFLAAYRRSTPAIRRILESNPFGSVLRYRPGRILSLLTGRGWTSAKVIEDWVEGQILPGEARTFGQLGERGVNLVVVASRYVRRRGGALDIEDFHFDSIRTPRVSIAKAISASCAIPGVFKPVPIRIGAQDWWFADGALSVTLPLRALDHLSPEKVMGVMIWGEEAEAPPEDPWRPSFWGAGLENREALARRLTRLHIEDRFERVVRIKPNPGCGSWLDFNLTPSRLRAMELAGSKAVKAWADE